MHRRTAATRLVLLTTVTALTASLVGTVTVQARESRSTGCQLRINGRSRARDRRRSIVPNGRRRKPADGDRQGLHPRPRPAAARGHGLAGDSCASGRGPAAFPVPSTSNGDPLITQATAFPGLAAVSKGATDGEPPDPWVAAGPEHVVQAVNRAFRISDRSGNTLQTIDMFDFFGLGAFYTPGRSTSSIPGSSTTASMAAGSRSRRASIASRLPEDTIGTGYIDVAVSDAPDPTPGWRILSDRVPRRSP